MLILRKEMNCIEIKIIGSNCSTGIRLKKIIKKVSDNHHVDIAIQELNHNQDKIKYHVNKIPVLVIDDKIISQGKILSDQEIKKLIVNHVVN